ncbi:MAG: hypothetical protein QOI95_3357 [Acidimicrobiaceae bacterium]|jgi:hypothetical protein
MTAVAFADPGNGNAYGHANANSNASGDLTAPQPASNADSNGTGANTSGPYDSTRDGSASANGNGDGNATGQPCAGCVGKADNKNPLGQLPGPDDNNNGYECDGNNGIAQTNPAHTGCGEVLGETLTPPTPPAVLGETLTRPAATAVLGVTLARTGFDVVKLMTFAALMIAGGGFILAGGRRLERHRI